MEDVKQSTDPITRMVQESKNQTEVCRTARLIEIAREAIEKNREEGSKEVEVKTEIKVLKKLREDSKTPDHIRAWIERRIFELLNEIL